jgi:hypothetical protein
MKFFAKQMTLVGSMIIFGFLSACGPGSEESDLENTLSEQRTEIAQLSTQSAKLEQINKSQWDAISYLSTQMPYALEIITPIPPFVTITPTAYVPNEPELDPTFTPTPVSSTNIEYPLVTRTGIEEIDRIIDVILSHNIEARVEFIRYTTSACTTADGLGGPPKCTPGEADGTLVEAFPVSSAEGTHVRPAQIEDVMDFTVRGLLAVYRVPEDAYKAEYWPAGEYGVAFSSEDDSYPHTIILLVERGQILRLDYVMGWPPFDLLWERSAEFVLDPLR